MRRRQMFEFEDQKWLPRAWREDLLDYLQHQLVAGRIYAPAIPKLMAALAATGESRIVDLGSGGGATIADIAARLRAAGWRGNVTATDLYPPAEPRHHPYHPRPVDAMRVPAELQGLRTLFTVFHHFAPRDGQTILTRAVANRAPVAIFEFTQRRSATLFGMLLSPAMMWAHAWRRRPGSRRQLFWTYVIPVLPLLYWWDGTVSHLRTYTADELCALATEADPDGAFSWDAGTIGARPLALTYLIGLPMDIRGTARPYPEQEFQSG